jgi:DNA-binding CsgD family transcriptional regulator
MTVMSLPTSVRDVALEVAARGQPPSADLVGHRPSAITRTDDRDGLRSAMEDGEAALAVVNAALRIQDNNRALLEQCGQTAESLIGRNVCDLLHPSVRLVMMRHLERLLERRRGCFVEHLSALWESNTSLSGTVTGIANHGPGGQVESILLMISAELQGHRRTLTRPTKLLSRINAQILEGVAAGAPTVQLATRLFLSRQGVEYHVGNMLRQFKVPNRAALVSKSYAMGLFKIGSWPPRVLDEYVRP